jgi:glycosyltransferase involved in cell wall biosynthesis
MLKYYSEEIDIYVDMSVAAGRQNGLIEAGSCGRPIISSNVGIAGSLITKPEHGILVERDINSISDAISKISNDYQSYSYGISNRVREVYSWDVQSKLFENCFNEVIKNV